MRPSAECQWQHSWRSPSSRNSKRAIAAVVNAISFFRRAGFALEPVTEEQACAARQAWSDFGKDRSPAKLNFGDCFSYALARTLGEPLLFKGADFSRTDVSSAI